MIIVFLGGRVKRSGDERAALSLGKAPSGPNDQAKGKSPDIYEPSRMESGFGEEGESDRLDFQKISFWSFFLL